jgi:hypothetical protein
MSQRAACTIITASYLAYAKTLAETLRLHNQDLPLYVLIVDPPADFDRNQFTSFKPLYLDVFADRAPAFEQMSFYYSAPEFCWALRGLLHEYFLEQTDYESWVFLDSDIMVNGSLEPVFEQLRQCSILLNPHFQKTGYLPAGSWIELSVLKVGKFNGGFLGLRRSTVSRAFIDWFKARLERFCFDAPNFEGLHSLSGDFPEVQMLRHPGANLAHWNLFEREVVLHPSGGVSVDGQPLLFTHFSGWSIEDPEAVSRYSPHYTNPPNIPAWEKIGRDYANHLLKQGYAETIGYPYGFGHFKDGQSITPVQRRLYYNDCRQGNYPVDQPFDHPERFVDRAHESIEGIGFVREELERTQRFAALTQGQLATAQQHLNGTQQQLDQSQQQLGETQQQLVETQQQLVETQQQLAACQQQLGETQQQSHQLQVQSSQQQQQLGQYESQLFELQQTCEDLQQGQVALKMDLEAHHQQLQASHAQSLQQQNQIDLMQRSKFWKLGCLWYTFWHRVKQQLR